MHGIGKRKMTYDNVADKFQFLLNLQNYEIRRHSDRGKNIQFNYINDLNENFEMETIHFKENMFL